MPLVKFISTGSPADRTGEIRLANKDGQARILVLGGPAVEVTGEELAPIMSNGYVIEEVETSSASEPEAAPAPAPAAVPSAPQTPVSGATPSPASPGA